MPPPAALTIRPATPADVEPLADLYAAAVRALGPSAYSADQVAAWAAFAEEPAFRRFVLGAETVVAERPASGPIGFAGLTPAGRVASLYVHPDHARQGVASALLSALIERAYERGMDRLSTEASALSRPVFERFGFALEAEEHVERRGAWFTRYRMARPLEPAPA